MFSQLNKNEQNELHKQYRTNDLFRQWSPVISEQEWRNGELDLVSLWHVGEKVLQELRETEAQRDEMIVFLFRRLVKDFRTILDEDGSKTDRSAAEAECSAVAVMCLVLTQLMNAVQVGEEEKDFGNRSMCVAIMGLLRSHPYFNVLMEKFFARQKTNDGKKVVITPFDPILTSAPDDAPKKEEIHESTMMAAVIKKEKTTEIISLIHQYMSGKTKPKDILRPLRAAIDAGAIRRPSLQEYIGEFGSDKKKLKTSLSNYTNPQEHPFDGDEQFTEMVKKFREIIL